MAQPLAVTAVLLHIASFLIQLPAISDAPTSDDPYEALQTGFQATYAALVAAQGASAIESYHTPEAPFCMAAARGFFAQVP